MISVPYMTMVTAPEEPVLNLCVRKAEVVPEQGFTRFKPEKEVSNSPDGDLSPKGFRSLLPKDSGYTTLHLLQNRLYDDHTRSPLYESEHGGSVRSDSPPLSPKCTDIPQVTADFLRGKPTRPFKAYPKDPLLLARASDGILSDSEDAYAQFRQRMLEQVRRATGGCNGNKNMRRPVLSTSPTNQQPSSSMDPRDSAYLERRRKNNEAAKRSRDARRAKEDELAIRAAFLEQENVKLKYEVAALRDETNRLRCLLYTN